MTRRDRALIASALRAQRRRIESGGWVSWAETADGPLPRPGEPDDLIDWVATHAAGDTRPDPTRPDQ